MLCVLGNPRFSRCMTIMIIAGLIAMTMASNEEWTTSRWRVNYGAYFRYTKTIATHSDRYQHHLVIGLPSKILSQKTVHFGKAAEDYEIGQRTYQCTFHRSTKQPKQQPASRPA